MKNTAFKYGLYSGGILLVLFIISFFAFENTSYGGKEIVGYLSIFIALTFIFFGIKSYRDGLPDGKISFGKAFSLGLLIVIIPSLVFAIFNAVYMTYIEPGFAEDYYAQSLKDLANHYSGEALASEIAAMEDSKALITSVTFNSFLMGITVFLMGLIVSLISAATLRRT